MLYAHRSPTKYAACHTRDDAKAAFCTLGGVYTLSHMHTHACTYARTDMVFGAPRSHCIVMRQAEPRRQTGTTDMILMRSRRHASSTLHAAKPTRSDLQAVECLRTCTNAEAGRSRSFCCHLRFSLLVTEAKENVCSCL